jgi:hypothetical protein
MDLAVKLPGVLKDAFSPIEESIINFSYALGLFLYAFSKRKSNNIMYILSMLDVSKNRRLVS